MGNDDAFRRQTEKTPLKRLVICGDLKCHKVSSLIFHLNIFRFTFHYHFRLHLVLWLNHLKIDASPYHAISFQTYPAIGHMMNCRAVNGLTAIENKFIIFLGCFSGKQFFGFEMTDEIALQF